MKRILCFIIATGLCVSSCAIKNKNKNSNRKPTSKTEVRKVNTPKTKTSSTDASKKCAEYTALEKELKEIKSKNDILKADTARLGEENRTLQRTQKETEELLSEKKYCRMQIRYPLMVKYDSALVERSLYMVEKFKMADKDENRKYCEAMLPVLRNYGKYQKEFYDMVYMIFNAYVVKNRSYTLDNLNISYEASSYYIDCASHGANIPYLDNKKEDLEILIKLKMLTKDNLKKIMNELK